jgi:hypothetical protein
MKLAGEEGIEPPARGIGSRRSTTELHPNVIDLVDQTGNLIPEEVKCFLSTGDHFLDPDRRVQIDMHDIAEVSDDPEAGEPPASGLSVVPPGPAMIGEAHAIITGIEQRGAFRVEFICVHLASILEPPTGIEPASFRNLRVATGCLATRPRRHMWRRVRGSNSRSCYATSA